MTPVWILLKLFESDILKSGTLRSWIVVPTGINVPTGQMMEIQLTYLPE